MKKLIKFGIFGLGRGASFYNTVLVNNGEIVAVCDRDEAKLAEAKKLIGNDVATYTDFDAFIEHKGLEAVFLCNYFHQHAPYAIRALEKNIHVLSECTSNGTMAESVALVRAAEKSKALYMLSENYPFMLFNQEMYRVVKGGTLGKIMYAEGEYNHPFDPYSAKTCKGLAPYAGHWRNHLPRTYYITHSLAPLMHITGAVPVRVTAMPVWDPFPADSPCGMGRIPDRAAVLLCLNDDDSVFRVTGCAAFGAHSNSYRICGERGQIENIRGGDGRVMLRYNGWEVPEGREKVNEYVPEWEDADRELIEKTGHGGGDFFVIRTFFDAIRENKQPEFDVYFATTMASVAMLGHRSLLARGEPFDIPDFHREEDRVKYENDRLSPFVDPADPNYIAADSHKTPPDPEKAAAYNALMAKTE